MGREELFFWAFAVLVLVADLVADLAALVLLALELLREDDDDDFEVLLPAPLTPMGRSW